MKYRVWTVISCIVILFLSIMSWYLYGANKASHNKAIILTEYKKTLEINIADITRQKRSMEEKLADITAKNDDAMAKISEYGLRVEGLTAEQGKLRSVIDALNREIADKNSETEFLKKSLKQIDKKLQKMKTENAGTKNGIAENAVQLGTIVATRPSNNSGKILEVNRNYGFVIINLGSDDGISTGDTLFVFRKKTLLGRIVVEDTQQRCCAAKILYKSLGDVVEKGDSVSIP